MQQVWRKRWVKMGWVTLGVVTIGLLVAGVYKKNHKFCKGIEVVFNGDGNNYFIDEKGVAAMLKQNGVEVGMEMEKINLRQLEEKLGQDQWIANAELYFDNRQVLKAVIKEKEPVARVFTVDGSSFYIDSSSKRLPISERLSARIPMFTGFPSGREVLSKPDSALLESAKRLAMFIQADEFWKAQVAQVDITPDGFEMIPTIGAHIVLLGKDENYQEKFDRLFSFYKQVWMKVGFETYEKLDVRYDGQVVATLKGTRATQVVDSVKVKAALERLVANNVPDTADVAGTNHATVLPHIVVASDTTKGKASPAVVNHKPLAIMPKPVSATVSPKVNNKKPVAVKTPSVQKLTSEEEMIRREALHHMNGISHGSKRTNKKQMSKTESKTNHKKLE